MNKLNIEVNDVITFNRINFTKKNVVVSKEVLEILDGKATVEAIRDDAIKTYQIDDWIPIEWVKEVTWKHYTDKELERKDEIKKTYQEELEKHKFIKINGYLKNVWMLGIVNFIVSIILFVSAIEFFKSFNVVSNVFAVFSVFNFVVFLAGFIYDMLRISDRLTEKEYFKVFDKVMKKTNFTIKELKRLEIWFNYYLEDYFDSIGVDVRAELD